MPRKPWIAKLISASLILVPVVALGLVYYSVKKMGFQVTTALLVDLWILSAASVVAAFGVWRVRPWGFIVFFIFAILVVVADVTHIINDPKTLNFWDFIDVTLVALGIIFILQREARAPYFNPQIRWWERPERHKVDLNATLVVAEKPVSSQLLDLSESGCFIDTNHEFSSGDLATLKLTYEDSTFQSPVRVIRTSTAPKGVGLMFVDTTALNTKEIKHIIKSLKKNLTTETKNPRGEIPA
jgi:Tfp pilus assembly protein PilZ